VELNYQTISMWELIANGLNVIGSMSSAGSFISSFSIDRNMKIIENSVLNIEKDLKDFNSLFRDIGKPEYLEKFLENLIDSQRRNEIKSDEILNALSLANKSQEKLIMSLTEFVKDIKGAYKFIKTDYAQSVRSLHKELIYNPFNAGISQFWDVSASNSLDNFPGKTISNSFTPISWTNPNSGQHFLGEMHNNSLHRFGINVQMPHYKFNQDGFIYDATRGLYLPNVSFKF
jgi:hypothetical protein